MMLVQVLSLSLRDQDSPTIATQLAGQAQRLTATATKGGGHQGRTTEAPVSLAELLGVAVAMYSWVAGEGRAMSTPEEEEELKEALTDLALTRRSCDTEFLQTLGIGKGSYVHVLFCFYVIAAGIQCSLIVEARCWVAWEQSWTL